jgi:hypothetical protein
MDRVVLRRLSRDSSDELIRQLEQARADVERAACNIAVAMQTAAAALQSLARHCSESLTGDRGTTLEPPSGEMSRAVIATQYDDITRQALAHVGLRLRSAEAIVKGLAALQEAAAAGGDVEPADRSDPHPACVRLEDAIARARELRTPCAATGSAMSSGTIDLF